MKKLPCLALLTAAAMAFPGFTAFDLRADDQVPPVPPGNTLPPPSKSSTTSSTSSTTSTTGGKKHGQYFEKLKQELGLKPGQVAKIKPILERTEQQAKALRLSVSLSATQKKQQIRQLHLAAFEQIRPILTPQQIQKWKQIREQHRSQSQTATT